MKTRQELVRGGTELAKEFCEANKLALPGLMPVERSEWRFDACAYYRPTYIKICVEKCAGIGTAGRQWSYPGYTVDRTPYGVIAHELGHHADYTLSEKRGAYFGDYSIAVRKASGEVPLTSYCPNDAEWFAEMFRLFVTNSDLLARLRPKTYRVLRERWDPVVYVPWTSVLKDAPARTILVATKKVEEAWR